MSTNNFGNLLILFGILLGFIFFAISDWRGGENGIIWNIRYAGLFFPECSGHGILRSCPYIIRLGHGLSASLFIIFLGLVIVREIISPELIIKYIPFLKK